MTADHVELRHTAAPIGCSTPIVAMFLASISISYATFLNTNSTLAVVRTTNNIIAPTPPPTCDAEYMYKIGFSLSHAKEQKVLQCVTKHFETSFIPEYVLMEWGYNKTNITAVRRTCESIVLGNNKFWVSNLVNFTSFIKTGHRPAVVDTPMSNGTLGAFCLSTLFRRDVSDFIPFDECEQYFGVIASGDRIVPDCTYADLQGICDRVHRYMTVAKKIEYCTAVVDQVEAGI